MTAPRSNWNAGRHAAVLPDQPDQLRLVGVLAAAADLRPV